MKLRRSMLFMPGNNPGMVQTAEIFGADSIIFDLEDAVSIGEKDAARNLIKNALSTFSYDSEIVIRINPLSTPFAKKDIDIIARLKPDAILLPKACKEDVTLLGNSLTLIEKEMGLEKNSIKIHALIETAIGVETVFETIASSSRIEAVLLGGEDLASDLNIQRTKDSEELFYARTKIINACRALNVQAIDTPFTDTNDIKGLEKDSRKAKMLGFSGKLSINPRQIDKIHEVWSPTADEISYAKRVIFAKDEALEKGLGVFSLNGKMIDAPIIKRAEHTLEVAKIIGLI